MARLDPIGDRSPDPHSQEVFPTVASAQGGSHPADGGLEALLTSDEASQILKIHPKVLERMAKRGEVPALKVGKFWATEPQHWTLGSIHAYNRGANRAACQLHSEWRKHASTISVRKFDAAKAEERT